MKLFGYYRSSTSYRVRIALNLKGVDFEQAAINLMAGEHEGPAFSAINVYRSLPVLDTGEKRLVQSLAILDWLELAYPNPSFTPGEPQSAQVCRELYYAIATEIHALNNLSVLKYLKSEFGANDTAIEKWNQAWVHRTFDPIELRLAEITWLSDALPFGAPSLFEIVLIPQIYNARRRNTNLAPYPLLSRIDAHCANLTAFKQAHPNLQVDAPEAYS